MSALAQRPSRLQRSGRRAALVLATLIASGLGSPAAAGPGAAVPGQAAPAGDVERGRYITHHVAMCVQCHTPRDDDGALDETRLFQGAQIPFESPFRGQTWATQAPAIAGASSFSPEDELSLLTTGKRRDGKVPQPPMPPFRLTREDALAVIAYLRSVAAR